MFIIYFTGCVSKILTRFYETGSIRPGSIGGSKTKVNFIIIQYNLLNSKFRLMFDGVHVLVCGWMTAQSTPKWWSVWFLEVWGLVRNRDETPSNVNRNFSSMNVSYKNQMNNSNNFLRGVKPEFSLWRPDLFKILDNAKLIMPKIFCWQVSLPLNFRKS